MKYNRLCDNGPMVSQVSLGGAAFSNIYGNYDQDKGVEMIKACLNHGINYFETGPWYGQGSSEYTFGKALKDIPRDMYYIGSKVGRYELIPDKMFDFSTEKTAVAVDTTLERLGIDYVDVIQVHDPTFAPNTSLLHKETLPTLAQAVRDGKARYIGLADYDIELLKEILEESEVKISTVLSYAKSTIIDNRLQNYVKYFESIGVGVINAAATGMGLLTNSGPQSWHPASDDIKHICRRASEYCKSQNVELARLATWFTLNQPGIATNICGFYNTDQLMDTLAAAETGLSTHEARVLEEIRAQFFEKVTLHWDNVELPAYRSKLQKLQL